MANKIGPTKGEEKVIVTNKVHDDNHATSWFSVRANGQSAEKWQMIVQWDFTNTTREELLNLAMSTLVIREQANFRKLDDAERKGMIGKESISIDVHEFVNQVRRSAGPRKSSRQVAIETIAQARGWTYEEAEYFMDTGEMPAVPGGARAKNARQKQKTA